MAEYNTIGELNCMNAIMEKLRLHVQLGKEASDEHLQVLFTWARKRTANFGTENTFSSRGAGESGFHKAKRARLHPLDSLPADPSLIKFATETPSSNFAMTSIRAPSAQQQTGRREGGTEAPSTGGKIMRQLVWGSQNKENVIPLNRCTLARGESEVKPRQKGLGPLPLDRTKHSICSPFADCSKSKAGVQPKTCLRKDAQVSAAAEDPNSYSLAASSHASREEKEGPIEVAKMVVEPNSTAKVDALMLQEDLSSQKVEVAVQANDIDRYQETVQDVLYLSIPAVPSRDISDFAEVSGSTIRKESPVIGARARGNDSKDPTAAVNPPTNRSTRQMRGKKGNHSLTDSVKVGFINEGEFQHAVSCSISTEDERAPNEGNKATNVTTPSESPGGTHRETEGEEESEWRREKLPALEEIKGENPDQLGDQADQEFQAEGEGSLLQTTDEAYKGMGVNALEGGFAGLDILAEGDFSEFESYMEACDEELCPQNLSLVQVDNSRTGKIADGVEKRDSIVEGKEDEAREEKAERAEEGDEVEEKEREEVEVSQMSNEIGLSEVKESDNTCELCVVEERKEEAREENEERAEEDDEVEDKEKEEVEVSQVNDELGLTEVKVSDKICELGEHFEPIASWSIGKGALKPRDEDFDMQKKEGEKAESNGLDEPESIAGSWTLSLQQGNDSKKGTEDGEEQAGVEKHWRMVEDEEWAEVERKEKVDQEGEEGREEEAEDDEELEEVEGSEKEEQGFVKAKESVSKSESVQHLVLTTSTDFVRLSQLRQDDLNLQREDLEFNHDAAQHEPESLPSSWILSSVQGKISNTGGSAIGEDEASVEKEGSMVEQEIRGEEEEEEEEEQQQQQEDEEEAEEEVEKEGKKGEEEDDVEESEEDEDAEMEVKENGNIDELHENFELTDSPDIQERAVEMRQEDANLQKKEEEAEFNHDAALPFRPVEADEKLDPQVQVGEKLNGPSAGTPIPSPAIVETGEAKTTPSPRQMSVARGVAAVFGYLKSLSARKMPNLPSAAEQVSPLLSGRKLVLEKQFEEECVSNALSAEQKQLLGAEELQENPSVRVLEEGANWENEKHASSGNQVENAIGEIESKSGPCPNICTSVVSFAALMKKPPPPLPPAAGKKGVKVRALEAAEAARREQERKAEERKQRRVAMEKAKEEKERQREQEMERARERGREKNKERVLDKETANEHNVWDALQEKGEEDGRMTSVRPHLSNDSMLHLDSSEFEGHGAESKAYDESQTALSGQAGPELRQRKATSKTKMDMEKTKKMEEEKKLKEEEKKKKDDEVAGRKRQREEVVRAKRGETERQAEKQRAELEEKERRRKAAEEAERERKAAEDEQKREKRLDRERDIERRRREEEEAKVAKVVEKAKIKDGLFQKRKEWEDDEKKRLEGEKRARLGEAALSAAHSLHGQLPSAIVQGSPVWKYALGGALIAPGVKVTGSIGNAVKAGATSSFIPQQGLQHTVGKDSVSGMGMCEPSYVKGSAMERGSSALAELSLSAENAGALRGALRTAGRSGPTSFYKERSLASLMGNPPSEGANKAVELKAGKFIDLSKESSFKSTERVVGGTIGSNLVVGPGGWLSNAAVKKKTTEEASIALAKETDQNGKGALGSVEKSSLLATKKSGGVKGTQTSRGGSEDPDLHSLKATPVVQEPIAVPIGGPANYEISPYRDSDDEDDEDEELDRRAKKPCPLWTKERYLMPHVIAQAAINPDEIFDDVKTCDLNEVFTEFAGLRKKRNFRKRTSSGNWSDDRLTLQDQIAYKKAMGYV